MDRHDKIKLQQLCAELDAATKKAVQAARAAPKPLNGPALKRYLDADAKVQDIVGRIKEIKTGRKPK
jgi:hypothetical protein